MMNLKTLGSSAGKALKGAGELTVGTMAAGGPLGNSLKIAGGVSLAVVPALLTAHNNASLGPVSYEPGMSNMTKPLNRGTVQAMKKAANGDPKIFNDMARHVVRNGITGGAISEYGVDTAFVSAFYGV